MKRKSVRIAGIVTAILFILMLAFMGGEQPDGKTAINKGSEDVFVQETAAPTASPVTVSQEKVVAVEQENEQETSKKEKSDVEDKGIEKRSATEEPSITEEKEEAEPETEPNCTLSICCDEVLKNPDVLADEKREFIPSGGWILQEETVSFTEGETVFDLLLRETKSRGIHFEFVYTPMYQSAYIEGIGNLYEFDCGDTSGWFYKVNGEKPMFGCSQYMLKQGDKVEFVYTCNFLKNNR
ncbi:MAG: DUF4430 domain-containing protein [Ruminococcaceae bacterium]|nr:DUF4430 domain-containing protein [Oscillospiraceae bacterium]